MSYEAEHATSPTPGQPGVPPPGRRPVRFALVAFFGVFLTLWFGVCFYNLADVYLINQSGIRTWGTVRTVARESSAESDGVRFDVVFHYQGKAYQVANRILASDTTYRVGERVPVKFRPDDPARAIFPAEEGYASYLFYVALGSIIGWGAWQVLRSYRVG